MTVADCRLSCLFQIRHFNTGNLSITVVGRACKKSGANRTLRSVDIALIYVSKARRRNLIYRDRRLSQIVGLLVCFKSSILTPEIYQPLLSVEHERNLVRIGLSLSLIHISEPTRRTP